MDGACSFQSYRLSCSLVGHDKDVKALCSVSAPVLAGAACLASASRDRTVRVWTPAMTAGYTECLGLCSHAGYVNAVAWLAPCDDWCPGGLLYSAGMDKVIYAFTLDSAEPVARLEGHEANVCGLTCCPGSRLLLSASWDRTARVWHRNLCVCVLADGHEAAVWSAISFDPEEAVVVTAGADRLIKLWSLGAADPAEVAPGEAADDRLLGKQKAVCIGTRRGHEDAVRGLCRLPRGRFLSCSNDSTVRLWRLHADACQMTFEGHAAFVYALAAISEPGDDGEVARFASTGEDRTCRVWSLESGACLQTIATPCQSVWAVCCLANGDLAVAGSDAIVRVFTSDADRAAPPDELLAFETEVADSAIPTKIGDLDTEKLPGPEALARSGNREGQVIMVRRGARIEAHQWSAAEDRWQKVGDVVGGQGGETVSGGGGGSSGGRTLYEGEFYDYLFTVDVEEGKPPLNLPYNRTEDPWFAAQRFIDRHLLPQAYLDQVAGFIRTNAGEAPTIASHGTYTDPYTGAGRYIPGGGGTVAGGGGSAYSDPFTGGSRYVPGSGGGGGGGGGVSVAGGGMGVTAELQAKYLPHKELQILSAGNIPGLKKKLSELSSADDSRRLLPSGLADRADALISGEAAAVAACDPDVLRAVAAAATDSASTPPSDGVPLLDLLRLACRFGPAAAALAEPPRLLRQLLARFLAPGVGSSVACQMLAARLVANMAASAAGVAWLRANRDWVLGAVDRLEFVGDNPSWQIAVSSALCNLCILLTSPLAASSDVEGQVRLLESLHRFLTAGGAGLKSDAAFLVVVSVGTLLVQQHRAAGEQLTVQAKDLGIKPLVARFTDPAFPVKLTEAATVVSCLV